MTAQTSRPLTAPTCPCRRSPPSSRSSSPNWTFRGSRWSATTPSLFGALSKQRIPEDLFGIADRRSGDLQEAAQRLSDDLTGGGVLSSGADLDRGAHLGSEAHRHNVRRP